MMILIIYFFEFNDESIADLGGVFSDYIFGYDEGYARTHE
jgi:hypothetical protein